MKPASLAEERIAETREYAEADMVNYDDNSIPWRIAETTLALLAEREEMLDLLARIKRDVDEIGSIGMIGGTAYERLVEFLTTRTAGKETG
jgi:hypothetical protein